ncbi:hypothetical protein [Paenibacillus sp. FSL H3-0310]|uniref:hypothetical protein n=1 Tax=Paenibacillus sp. FSL H3-0310 TaxID=2921429 RepID=UPI0030F98D61
MINVFVHVHDEGESEWENECHLFSRVPIEKEYFALSHDGNWYEVEMVVHTPFDQEVQAEIYAVKVDHMEIKRSKLNTESGFDFGVLSAP